MLKDGQLYIAHSDNGNINLVGKMANRHGLIAGATGTGKTVTLQVLAETFSQAGVPCFMADMKGDLSGISQPGKLSGFIEKRMPEFGIENPQFSGCPHPLLRRLRRTGLPDAGHHLRYGAPAPGTPDGTLRGPGRRPQRGLPHRR